MAAGGAVAGAVEEAWTGADNGLGSAKDRVTTGTVPAPVTGTGWVTAGTRRIADRAMGAVGSRASTSGAGVASVGSDATGVVVASVAGFSTRSTIIGDGGGGEKAGDRDSQAAIRTAPANAQWPPIESSNADVPIPRRAGIVGDEKVSAKAEICKSIDQSMGVPKNLPE